MRFGPYSFEVSKPEKVLFPESGITKADLVEYYRRVADWMVPLVRGRPLMMHRHPDGIDGKSFYQKEAPDYFPEWVHTERVAKEGGALRMVLCDNAATLAYLANQATVTPHVWLSRADRPEHPDRLIFDLDPSDEDFSKVRGIARVLGKLLRDLGLRPYAMTTGSRGLHVLVPLNRTSDFDTARSFAQDVASLLERRNPERVTTEQRREKRGKKLFLDTGRNAYAQTAVAPYAVRAKPHAPVATPLTWKELEDSSLNPQKYNVKNIFLRLDQVQDPWRGLGRHGRGITRPREKLDSLLDREG